MATDFGLDSSGSNPGGDEIFRLARPALGPTQPPVKWAPDLSRGVKCGRGVLLTTHPLLVPRSWKSRTIPLPTFWATLGNGIFTFTYMLVTTILLRVKSERSGVFFLRYLSPPPNPPVAEIYSSVCQRGVGEINNATSAVN